MDSVKAKKRLYFLQDLKNLMVKHNAIFEVSVDNQDHYDVQFLYDLNGLDDPFECQIGNMLGYTGDFDVIDVDNLINKELKEIEDDKQSNN